MGGQDHKWESRREAGVGSDDQVDKTGKYVQVPSPRKAKKAKGWGSTRSNDRKARKELKETRVIEKERRVGVLGVQRGIKKTIPAPLGLRTFVVASKPAGTTS